MGRFSFTTSGDLLEFIIEIQADGYLPARLTKKGPIKGDSEFSFELERAGPINGIVQLPKGTPVVGATVILSAEQARRYGKGPPSMEQVYMRVPGQFDLTRSQLTRVETDPVGRFSLRPKLGTQRILVAHKAGFAEVSREELAASPIVRLRPWGRVTGTLKIGRLAAANETLQLRNWNGSSLFSPSLYINLEAKTDEQGRFLIEGVPSGDWQLFHEVNLRSRNSGSTNLPDFKPIKVTIGHGYSMIMPTRSGYSHGAFVHLAAGETAEVVLGGTGRFVVGKVRADPSMPPIDWQGAVQTLTSVSSRPTYPDRKRFPSDEAFDVAQQRYYLRSREFWLSEMGQAEQRNSRTYVLRFDTNGSFEVPDVIPGRYELAIAMSASGPPENPFNRKIIGRVWTQVVVPNAKAGEEDAPFDLGALELKPESP
jgi:hypothetical protein